MNALGEKTHDTVVTMTKVDNGWVVHVHHHEKKGSMAEPRPATEEFDLGDFLRKMTGNDDDQCIDRMLVFRNYREVLDALALMDFGNEEAERFAREGLRGTDRVP